jgi:hypothetical protein
VRTWLHNWRGLGHVVTGMQRQDYDLELTRVDGRRLARYRSSSPGAHGPLREVQVRRGIHSGRPQERPRSLRVRTAARQLKKRREDYERERAQAMLAAVALS